MINLTRCRLTAPLNLLIKNAVFQKKRFTDSTDWVIRVEVSAERRRRGRGGVGVENIWDRVELSAAHPNTTFI